MSSGSPRLVYVVTWWSSDSTFIQALGQSLLRLLVASQELLGHELGRIEPCPHSELPKFGPTALSVD